MKMTKEVKDYAIREFEKKTEEKKTKFFEPYHQEVKRYQKWADELAQDINDDIQRFKEEHKNEITVGLNVNRYDEKPRFTLSVSSCQSWPKFEAPDKMKFLAQLSTEESLDDLTALLDKYFN